MSTNGETADLMVREGIQITESALKLAGLGAKNLAALLIALANDNQKLAGKTNLKRLIHDGEELTIFSVKQEDLKGFQMEAKRYSGGSLGTLKIPTLGLSVKVYQGTDADALRKGAGHFASTSIWEGNVAIAGHNRGVNNHFGKIHTLDIGDTIKLTTQLGTRSYEVYSVSKIGVDDTSVLSDSTENIITLVTCVKNQPDYRWCVQAREK